MVKKAKKVRLHSHVIASLSSVSPHAHTGKKIHRKHTSHGFLFIILLLTGILLFSSLGMLRAYGVTSQNGTNIVVNILGDPPTEGAIITFPSTNTVSTDKLLRVAGTCPSQTLVSIYNNGTFAGSTTCSTIDDFEIIIQLHEGLNVIQAQNYDAMNQPGPVTPQYSITYEPEVIVPGQPNPTTSPEVIVSKADQLRPVAVIPQTPTVAPQPSEQPCYELPNGVQVTNSEELIISVSCIHHNISVGDKLNVSVSIHGGVAPYALLTSWGDTQSNLSSVSDSSVTTLSHVYQTSGIHEILLKTTDKNGTTSQIQTVVNVNGDGITAATATRQENSLLKNLSLFWVEAPVPLYIAAVTMLAGFWIGDIFERLHAKPGVRRHT